jgi:hypothetical protein
MTFLKPIQCYHSLADPIWPDGTFEDDLQKLKLKKIKIYTVEVDDFLRPIPCYHSPADPIWLDGTLKDDLRNFENNQRTQLSTIFLCEKHSVNLEKAL